MDMHVVNLKRLINLSTSTSRSNNITHNDMEICLNHMHFQEFPLEWKISILSLISKKLQKKYPLLMNNMVNEIRDTYFKSLQNFLNKVVLSDPCTGEHHPPITYLQYKCINEKGIPKISTLLKHKDSLEKKYFLSLEPIRIIINKAHDKLPLIICNFEHYHHLGLMSLTRFQSVITNDIKKASLTVASKFYVGVAKGTQTCEVLKNVNSKKLPTIMRCITHVFVQQILNVMMRSINHMLNSLRDANYSPQIKFQLILQDNQLLVSPSIEETYCVFKSIIEKIATIAEDLAPLEEWHNIKTHVKCIKVTLPDWYIKKSNERLVIILDDLFRPIKEHVRNITAEFYPSCAPSLEKQILSIRAQKMDFDLYLKHVKNYNSYLVKANAMVSNTYYALGKLEQYKGIESVKKEFCNITNFLLNKLTKYHREYNLSICLAFEDLKTKALNVPKDPKSLIKLTEYIAYALQDLIKDLEDRIQKSIHMIMLLSEVALLSEDHIQLNIKTINWLHEVEPIFKQSNILIETMKNELEDDIQNRINKLNADVNNIVPQLNVLDNMDDINNIGEYIEYYKGLLKYANQINCAMEKINEEEFLFNFPETEFPNVIEIHELITSFYDCIYIIYQWRKDHSVWIDGPFEWLDASIIKQRTWSYFEKITEMSSTFRMKIKTDTGDSKCFKFTGIADDPDPLQQPAPLKLCWQALNEINDFKKYIPLAICMCNPSLRKRHWLEMSRICNFDLTPNAGTTLRKLIALNLMGDIEKYEAISIGADKELELEEKFLNMVKEWDKISFEISYDKNAEMYIFSKLDDIELLLENQLIQIEEMKTSNFVEQIALNVTNFFASLTRIREIINEWYYAQSLVFSFKSIFNYPNIEGHLSEESALYKKVKDILKYIENKLAKTPVFTEINDVTLLTALKHTIENLEHIKQRVQNYMENKKLCFPRLCFLSDKEVQEMLFASSNVYGLEFRIQKCFGGIQNIKINEEKCICSIVGECGEEVHFEELVSFNVPYNHKEEGWLIHFEKQINAIVRKNIFQCIEIFGKTLLCGNIMNFPSMTIACALQLYWTADIHQSFTPFDFRTLNNLQLKYINHLNSFIDELKKCSTKRRRNLLTTIITIVIQQKDVIRILLDKNIIKTTDFEWVAQLRYYLENNDIQISIFQTTLKYGYEYGYYKQNIIATPLTDRCYHTLMQAHNYNFYGAIAGRPGTGKSETIKSLAKAIAVQFRAFDCAAILSYNYLTQIFKGFVSCGAWLCLENFDKLQSDLVAKITQILTSLFQAVAANSKIIMFEGSQLQFNSTGFVCAITQLGLYKHSNFPDNLKVLFRTITMVVPDMNKIIEIELSAAGICNSKLLTTKLLTFCKILSEQLWCESCKTYNLYSTKALTKAVIYLKITFPEESEIALLLRALIDINLPKYCQTDVHIFNNVLQDMFPNVSVLPPNYSTFLETLQAVCTSRFIHIHDVLKLKILQTFELMYVYRTLILIGNPFVGKTETLNILQDILLSLYENGIEFGAHVKSEILVPGALDGHQMFGYFDKKYNTWKDGICSKILRSFSKGDYSGRKWLIFDGFPSNIHIENSYAIFGTSNTLQLSSGEKINIDSSVSVIFETMNLANMSPGIVPNCGIIYLELNSADCGPYIKTHISKYTISDEHKEILYSLFNWVLNPCLQFVEKYCTVTSNVGQLHYIISILNLFEMYLKDSVIESTEEKGKTNHFLIWVQIALLIAVIWGLGGNLNKDSHIKFNSFCISLWSGTNTEHPKPEIIKCSDITFPVEGLIQDNFYTFKGIGNWKYWGSVDVLKNEQILEIPDCNEIFVPTMHTMKYNYLFLKHIKHRKSFILCGELCSGKTFLLKNFLKNKMSKEIFCYCSSFLSFNTVCRTQQLVLSKLYKVKKRHYKTPAGHEYFVNFIDDLDAQKSDFATGIKAVLELLRQYHNYGYFYDNESEKIFLYDVMFLLSITGTTTSQICPRFLSHFNLYTIHQPNNDTIFRIFSNILFSNLKKNSFTADVLNTVTSISNATIDIYNSILKTLQPIPAKFQYQFNLKDVANVFSGYSLLQKESVETKITYFRLWTHEIWRVFGDRILDNNDKEWLFLQIKDVSKSYFKDSFEAAFDYLPRNNDNEITAHSFSNLMFCNFMNNKYEEINSIEKLKNKIHFYLTEYNSSNTKDRIDITVSQYVLECLIKISRTLTIPGGHLIMISSIGSGRKSLASIAAYMQQQEFLEPSVNSYNDLNIWREDLKKVLQKCGTLGRNLTFFLKDGPERDKFFHDIICFLTTGEIPNLFSIEEKCNIIQIVRLYAQGGDKNSEINNDAVMSYFIEQCKNKIHFIICFNVINKVIRLYLHKYPELLKYCTINWYEIWPLDALTQIGSKFIQNINIKDDLKEHVIKVCINFHDSMKDISTKYWKETGCKVHVTLSAFLHILKLYVYLTSEKQEYILTMKNKYLIGLEKLELAAQQVEKMKARLNILKPQLESSAKKTANTMREVENENISIEKATILLQEEEAKANKKAEIAGRLKMECETDLAVAIPILEDAIAALNTLKPTDITLVKAMKNPPDTVKLVMAAICVMLDVPPDKAIDSTTGKKYTDYWSASKRILSDMNFLQILKDYDKNNIPSNIVETIKKTYITDSNFKPHIVAKASSAAEGLCKWVRAMVSYDEVAKTVAPKKEKWFIAQAECNQAEAFLNEKRKTLSALSVKLADLNNNLEKMLQQKLKLENDVEMCTNKLEKAENLMASLEGEKDRWLQFSENLGRRYDNIIGDVLLTSGIISYLAPYDTAFRDKILSFWKLYLEKLKIPYSADYSLTNILREEIDISNSHFPYSHKSNFAIENSLIMKNSKLWSLCIDPENQANEWIKAAESKNNLKVVKLTESDLMATILFNIKTGIPTLIENVSEKLEVLLDPLFLKKICHQEGCSYLDISCDTTHYSSDFRLYMTTRSNNAQFSCEIYNRLTIINYTIPKEDLQNKLLDFITSKEKPDVQEKFETLLVADCINKNTLKKQKHHILNIISSSTTNILEDESALKSLNETKTSCLDINKKQQLAEAMSTEINKFRNIYVQFAQYCTDLFLTLSVLSRLNYMYCFSFSWFMQLYKKSIEISNRSLILERRLKFLKSSVIQNLYSSICRSLFEKHKISYSFLLCCKILLNNRQTTEEEINYFMRPNLDHLNELPDCVFKWLPKNIWVNIYNLSKRFPIFSDFLDSLHNNANAWKEYYNCETLESDLIPEPWVNKLSLFQKLLLVKSFRPDRIAIHIMQFIKKTIGDRTNYSPETKISESYIESNCCTPLLFILPASLTPLSLISACAKAKGCLSKFVSLSISAQQEENAEFLIKQAQRDGSWIFIQNCHLVPNWLVKLEEIFENCNNLNISPNFRLWLSSNPMKEFPINILQNCVKIVNDYPFNIKDVLLNIYQSEPIVNKDFFESCPGKNETFSKLLFGICLFHTVVEQRRNFKIQGWNMPYKFDHYDLQISIMQLQETLNNTDHVPFSTLLYLIGKCNYGEKLEDEFDKRCLKYFLKDYCNSDMITCHEGRCSNKIKQLMPLRCEYSFVIEHIKKIPLNFSPQVFGSSKNSIYTQNIATGAELLSCFSYINCPTLAKNEQFHQDEILALINEINGKLLNIINKNNIPDECSSMLNKPLHRVLLFEIKSLRDILETIADSLANLKAALNGTQPFTNPMEQFATELYKLKVPYAWTKTQEHIVTTDLSYYIDNLLKHSHFINKWIIEGDPKIVWFDRIFHHKMFLSAILLIFSKKYNIPAEEIIFNFEVATDGTIDAKDIDGYVIYGLHLCGAQWNLEKNILIENCTNETWLTMPPILLKYSLKKKNPDEVYDCPIYISAAEQFCKDIASSSENCILSVPLRIDLPREHWIKCSAALFCHASL